MADVPSIGTASVRVIPDTGSIATLLGEYFGSTKFASVAKKGGLALGAGFAAVGVAKVAYDIGAEFDHAFDKIRTQTGATGKELTKLEGVTKRVFANTPSNIDDVAEAVSGLSQRLDLAGKPLRKMSQQLVELSDITDTDLQTNIKSVTKALQEWEVPVKKQGKVLDGFYRISQETGITVSDLADQLTGFAPVMETLGYTMGQSAALFGSFEKAGVDTAKMAPGLKIAIANLTTPSADLADKMKALGIAAGEPQKALSQVLALMGDKSKLSDIDKTSLAMDTFGKKAGVYLADAVEKGRFNVQNLLDTFRNGKDTIGKAADDTYDFSEQWRMFVNRLKTTVEPVATKFFKSVGDLMKDVNKAFKKDGLDGVVDLLLQKLNDALPKIADKGGEIGLKLGGAILKAIGNAFVNSNVLGKLFIGAAALRLFGGPGVFGSLGTMIAKAMAKKLAPTLLSTVAADVAASNLPGRTTTPTPTPTGGGGTKIVPLVGAGAALAPAYAVGHKINEMFPSSAMLGNMDQSIDQIGRLLGLSHDAPKAVNAFGKLSDGLDTLRKSSLHLSRGLEGDTADETNSLKRLNGGFDASSKHGQDFGNSMRRYLKGFADDLNDSGKASDQHRTKTTKNFDEVNDSGKKMGRGQETVLGRLTRDLKGNSGDFDRWSGKAKDDLRSTGKSGDVFSKGMDTVFGNVSHASKSSSDVVKDALGIIQDKTNSALKALGVSKGVTFVATSVAKGADKVAGGSKRQKAAGGMVPGFGAGDTVPLHINGQLAAMVEPGEYVSVLNRKATAAMMDFNKQVPRFAGGGVVAMTALANAFDRASEPYLMGGGHGSFLTSPAPVDCSGAVSAILHAGGLLNGAPMDTVALANWGRPAKGNENLVIATRPLPGGDGHTVMSINGRTFGTGGENPNGGAGWMSGSPRDYVSGAVLRTMPIDGGASKIERLLIEGPAGALRTIAQKAVDKTVNAANDYIAKQMPRGTGGGGDAGGQLRGPVTGTATWYGPLDSQLGAPVSGMGGLLTGNQHAFAELGRGTSVGDALGGLAQGTWLTATIMGHTAKLQKRDNGGGGLPTDIIDVWEDSLVNFPGFREAGRAKVTVKPAQRGGIVAHLAGGGALNMEDDGLIPLSVARDPGHGNRSMFRDFRRDNRESKREHDVLVRLAGAGKWLRHWHKFRTGVFRAIQFQEGAMPHKAQLRKLYKQYRDQYYHHFHGTRSLSGRGIRVQRGGIVPHLANGGLAGGINRVIGRTGVAKPNKSKRMMRKLLKRIKGNLALDPDTVKLINALTDKVNLSEENAGYASTLGAPFQGLSEMQWLTQELAQQMDLRSALIKGINESGGIQGKTNALIKQAEERLKKIMQGIRNLGHKRNGTETDLDKLNNRIGDVGDHLGKLKDKLSKAKGKGEKDAISKQIDAVTKKRDELEDEKKKIDNKLGRIADSERLLGSRKRAANKIIERLTGRKSTISSGKNDYVEALAALQGTSGPMDIPPTGQLGGAILNTRSRLAGLTGTGTTSGISISQLAELKQAFDFGVLNSLPKMHSGGIVSGPPGSDQPRMLQAGEKVTPAGAAQAVNVRVYIGDRELTDIVRVEMDDRDAADHRLYMTGASQ